LATGVEEGAIRTSRQSGVTGDLPGGVDPARLAVFAAEWASPGTREFRFGYVSK